MGEKAHSNKLGIMLLDIGRKNSVLAKIIAWGEYMALPFTPRLKKKMEQTIQLYIPAHEQKNTRRIRKIKIDMLYSRTLYEINFIQYFLFEFEKRNATGRKEFVGDHEKARYTDDLHKDSTTFHIFRNKFKAYETFRTYYKRDLIEIKNEKDRDEFIKFAKKHSKFILKPENAALGKGISIIDQSTLNESEDELFSRLISEEGEYIAEELIVQAPEIMKIHPSSVNTVRFATYLKDDKVLHMFSFLRMGTGDGIIDNATSGGLSAAIDIETGIVTTPGCREDLTRYLKHPDTGVQIIGMQIPQWDTLLDMVNQLAHVVPEQKYVGWDLALTENGWVMVEGNDSAMMTAIQMCEKKGLRKIFDTAFKEK